MFKRLVTALAVSVSLVGTFAFSPSPALANGPVWSVRSFSVPSNLPPGGTGTIRVELTNVGDADATGLTTIQIEDKLPPGLTATSAKFDDNFETVKYFGFCPVKTGPNIRCGVFGELSIVKPYQTVELDIGVSVGSAVASPSSATNEVDVSGGGPPSVSNSETVSFDSTPAGFGVQQFEQVATNEDGSLDTQAGSHPFEYTTTFQLNDSTSPLPKDLKFTLPPGVVGNPTVIPQCAPEAFQKFVPETGFTVNLCPDNTALGMATVWITGEKGGLGLAYSAPVFNLVPNVGEPARFGFVVLSVPVIVDTSVRTGGDYAVVVSVNKINTGLAFVASQVTLWGVPADRRHDESRGNDCYMQNEELSAPGLGPCPVTPSEGAKAPPFLTLPTSCTGLLRSTVEADSWKQPGVFHSGEYTLHDSIGPVEMDGCNRLPFEPSIKVTPDGKAGSTPTGLNVDEHVPQETTLNPEGLAESDVKGLSVTLPEGVALNPAAADGLMACSEAQIGLQNAEASACPEQSKVATVKIKTPLLPNPLTGAAYLAAQTANPFGSLVALYVYAEDPVSGVRAKAAGEVLENPVTGQLTAHFERDPAFSAQGETSQFLPQLAFEDVELHFFGGDRAPLGTPAHCGSYTTTGTFTPWSGNPSAASSSTFDVTSGPDGSPCPGASLPFSPSLAAGTTSVQAGGFSPFTMTMSREDGQQSLKAIALHMPPGLSGLLTGVELCGEAQADAGACGPNSLIGETTVSVGLGGDPYSVRGGKVYITGPYEGAPFGLSIVVPAKAGPYDLGQVVVRGRIEVDPTTSALTVTTNSPSQGYAIPHILDGIPLQIKHVNFTTTRSGFTFNPTNCNPMGVTGSISSVEGASSAVSVPFQVTNCAVLGFKPGFKVSTSGKTSRANGASLHVKLTYPKAAFGSQANIAKVKVDLPKQLPSRLETLKKACLDSVFEQNPASCPAASRIGAASATTPVLPVRLEGPVYFVSHGGAKWPELIVVLQGYGVTVDLHSETFISKSGVTSSTFRTIPDVPVGTFELTLPEGPFSALAANVNLCNLTRVVTKRRKVTVTVHGKKRHVTRKVRTRTAGSLVMPTAFTAQNGAVIHENTPIEVTGCGKTKKAKKAARRNRHHRHAKGHKKG